MGQILSSNTVYAVAYLTEKGRNYLFDPMGSNRFETITVGGVATIIDKFKITYFSMSDPDTNYNLLSGEILETGSIPDVSGKNDGNIKGTLVAEETNLISFNGIIGGNINTDTGDFNLDVPVSLNTNLNGQIDVDADAIPMTQNGV